MRIANTRESTSGGHVEILTLDHFRERGPVVEEYLYFKILVAVFAARVALLAYRWRVTPNELTLTALALALPAGLLNLFGRFGLAIIVFHIFFIIDASDGVLARATGSGSRLGGYLDDLGHYAFHTVFLSTFALGHYLRGDSRLAITVLLFLATDTVFHAHQELTFRLTNRSPVMLARGSGSSLTDKIRSAVLGSFAFPNVLVYLTVLFWNPRLTIAYFAYATAALAAYITYTSVKTARVITRTS